MNEVYYTKKEFNEMKNSLNRENKLLKKRITLLENKVNKLKDENKDLKKKLDI